MTSLDRIAILRDISAALREAQILYHRLGDNEGANRMRDEGARVGLIATGRKAS